jgi:uridylate kinase
MKQHSPIIVTLGGSLIVPDQIDTIFLKKFKKLILKFLKKGKKFIIVAGGGKTARNYQKAVKTIVKTEKEDLDWIGVHATRINAHLLRTIFSKEACPTVLDNPYKKIKTKKPIIIASGWRPGWSTDYIAILIAKIFKIKEVIVAGKTPYVYTKDFLKYKDAKPLKNIDWKSYRKIIGGKWIPGMGAPVDPIGAKLAQKIGLKVLVVQGQKIKNFENLLNGKKFEGTIIK